VSGTLPTGGYPNWIDPASGDHCYARTGSSRLGQSPPPVCLCGHDFHAGPCEFIGACDGCDRHVCFCHCPDGELDGDR